jgi:phenylalanyl-tRNA synthetase beta chain
MKVSLNWLRDYLDLYKSPAEIAEILTSLGLEVEGWETVNPSPVDLDKVVTGLVLTCERIPDTDHLSATTVDTGHGAAPRSIVCGAPNVAAGQKVWVALPGAQVYDHAGGLFTIGERRVRGIQSQGMICAADELWGSGHDASGIIVLPDDTPLGRPAAAYYNLPSDTVIEIGLTPNRADATHHVGVARDLYAWLRYHENPSAVLNLPETDGFAPAAGRNPITVSVENSEACPRYTGVSMTGLTVKESPDWLKNRLLAVGIRPINNVVDVTNYVRAELGQPLHAFDAAAIRGNRILVKTLPEGSAFTTLDGVERKLFGEDLMICDGDSGPMCIGGVFGGASSGVQDGTTDIFLESAFFNPRWIRRSMLRHGLRTDSAWTFEKGVDPNGCRYALERAALLIRELAGGEIASEVIDIYPDPVEPARVPVEFGRVNRLIGEDLAPETVFRILQALSIGVTGQTATGFTALIPTNKPDVTREADVVEEILRIHGLDNVPLPSQIRSSAEPSVYPGPDAVRNLVANHLVALGFFEGMSLSLSNSAYFRGEDAPLPVPEETLVFVHNTANQGLDCMRPSLLFSGLEAIRHNQNRQRPDLRLFEFGKVYFKTVDGGLPPPPSQGGGERFTVHGSPAPDGAAGPRENGQGRFSETLRLGLFMTGAHAPESWQPALKKEVDFYTLKTMVQQVLGRLGISGFQETAVEEAPFRYALRYHRGAQELVTFGAVQPAILRRMDLKNAVFFADFHFENLLKALGAGKIQHKEPSKFPTVRRDLALVLDRRVTFGEIRQLAVKTLKKTLREVNLFDVFEDAERLGADKKSYAVSFMFEDPEKTLQDKDIDAMMQQLRRAFETSLNAAIRQ